MESQPNSNQPDPQKLLRIGDVAKQTGMTLRTLRYYEELRLIESDNRTKGNFRLYNPIVVNRIGLINSLKKLGFSLEEIGEILVGTDTQETDMNTIEKTLKVLQIKRETILEKRRELDDMLNEVDRSIHTLEECIVCRTQHCEMPCDPLCENKQAHIT